MCLSYKLNMAKLWMKVCLPFTYNSFQFIGVNIHVTLCNFYYRWFISKPPLFSLCFQIQIKLSAIFLSWFSVNSLFVNYYYVATNIKILRVTWSRRQRKQLPSNTPFNHRNLLLDMMDCYMTKYRIMKYCEYISLPSFCV